MIQENIRILINELNISQRKFALKIGVDPGYMSKILNGKAEVNERMILLIENVFNVNRYWLETGEGNIFRNTSFISTKDRVLEIIDKLDDDQIESVSVFLKFLQEQKKGR